MSLRYGVFLRPDPLTCWTQIQLTGALRQQFGLVSAAAFPPHATLVGNLRTDVSADHLVELLSPVFAEAEPFTVWNAGLMRFANSHLYDIHHDEHGAPNAPLVDLAGRVRAAVLPVSVPVDDHLVEPFYENRFEGHLSIASHDLADNPRLSDEVGEFLEALPLRPPARFRAEVFSLFACEADWAGSWWGEMTWRHLHSWDLRDGS